MVDGVEYVIVLVPKISVWSWAKTVILHFIMMRAAVRNALGTAILYNGHRYPVLVFCHVFFTAKSQGGLGQSKYLYLYGPEVKRSLSGRRQIPTHFSPVRVDRRQTSRHLRSRTGEACYYSYYSSEDCVGCSATKHLLAMFCLTFETFFWGRFSHHTIFENVVAAPELLFKYVVSFFH